MCVIVGVGAHDVEVTVCHSIMTQVPNGNTVAKTAWNALLDAAAAKWPHGTRTCHVPGAAGAACRGVAESGAGIVF